jgi:hypothetical protein
LPIIAILGLLSARVLGLSAGGVDPTPAGHGRAPATRPDYTTPFPPPGRQRPARRPALRAQAPMPRHPRHSRRGERRFRPPPRHPATGRA